MERFFGPQTWLKWGAFGATVGGIQGGTIGLSVGAFGSAGTIAVPAGFAGAHVGAAFGFQAGFLGARGIYGIYQFSQSHNFFNVWP